MRRRRKEKRYVPRISRIDSIHLWQVTVWRLLARLWLQCSVESGVEALVRVGASCLRHLVLHSSATWNAVDARLWNVAASALHLTVQSSLATVQNHLRHLEASMPPVQVTHLTKLR